MGESMYMSTLSELLNPLVRRGETDNCLFPVSEQLQNNRS